MLGKYSLLILGLLLLSLGSCGCSQQRRQQEALNQQLRVALRIGAAAEARQLIRQGADVNTLYRYDDDVLNGLTALDVAVGAEDAAFVRELLAQGAHVESNECNHPLTPLVSASVAGNLEIVKILIEAGAKIDYGPGNFTWPLLEAARGGHTDVVEYLLQHGAQVHYANSRGETALAVARENGHHEVVKILRAAGSQK